MNDVPRVRTVPHSPFTAASATFALNAGLWFRRVRFVIWGSLHAFQRRPLEITSTESPAEYEQNERAERQRLGLFC
jgi:hypothetical protein